MKTNKEREFLLELAKSEMQKICKKYGVHLVRGNNCDLTLGHRSRHENGDDSFRSISFKQLGDIHGYIKDS